MSTKMRPNATAAAGQYSRGAKGEQAAAGRGGGVAAGGERRRGSCGLRCRGRGSDYECAAGWGGAEGLAGVVVGAQDDGDVQEVDDAVVIEVAVGIARLLLGVVLVAE